MRKTTFIALFIVCMNLGTAFFAGAGVWQYLNVGYETDLGTRFTQVTEQANEFLQFEGGLASIGGTFIDTVVTTVELIIELAQLAVFGTPKLLAAFGAPGFVTAAVAAIMPIIAGLDIAAYMSGRET